MQKKMIIMLFSSFVFTVNAQTNETIGAIPSLKKNSYKQFIVPVALIASGALMVNTALNDNLQKNTNHFFGKNFHTGTDNYLPFVSVAQIYLGKYLGLKPKNDFQNQTINILVSNAISVSVIFVLKNTIKEERPDLSDNLSYPSGHTGIAFTNASLLYYEYKDSNMWYAGSGFLFATATGILRIANNKHYTSDVLTGAGIGLATGWIISYWNPFKSVSFGKKKKTTAFVYPKIGRQIGMGALIQLN